MEKLVVERSIWIASPRERVWQAITNAEQIQSWWGGGDYWEITALQVGGTVKFGDPDDLMLASIQVLDAPHQFTILWPPQPQYHSIEMTTTFILEEEKGGTRVTVTETGFEALPDDLRQTRLDKTGEGYTKVLASLKSLLEGK
jgi:uncharacterized protein YndB with AHSA1/START domain